MCLHLLTQFLVSLRAPAERPDHDSLSFVGFMIPAIAEVSRAQRDRSETSCRFPAAVSRYTRTLGPTSEAFHSAAIQHLCSSRCNAVYRDPVSTFNISPELVRIALLSAYPCR